MALSRITKVGGNSLEDPLNFTGGINAVGVITATAFVGDGSGLTGVTTNYYKGEIFGYDNVLDTNITITSSYKTAVIQVDRDLTVDIENGVTISVDSGCYLNIADA
jgi:hypothetical protein